MAPSAAAQPVPTSTVAPGPVSLTKKKGRLLIVTLPIVTAFVVARPPWKTSVEPVTPTVPAAAPAGAGAVNAVADNVRKTATPNQRTLRPLMDPP
jgi:hypothetical protein